MSEITTIKLSQAVKLELIKRKIHPRETYEQLIKRLVIDKKEVKK